MVVSSGAYLITFPLGRAKLCLARIVLYKALYGGILLIIWQEVFFLTGLGRGAARTIPGGGSCRWWCLRAFLVGQQLSPRREL